MRSFKHETLYNKVQKGWIGFWIAWTLLMSNPTVAAEGDCSSESSLDGRTDIVFCEPWERTDWWTNGYMKASTPSQETPVVAADVDRTSIVDTGCVEGSCLKVDIPARQCCGMSIHWPLKNAQGLQPEALYMRYYMKLAPNFDPDFNNSEGTNSGTGGKFPGLADVRRYPDEQCGNGGEPGDGINCWSARSDFRNCYAGSDYPHGCSDSNATTRFGHYLYYPPDVKYGHAFWDNIWWGQGEMFGSRNGLYHDGGCANRDGRYGIGNCGKNSVGQMVNDQWYLIEIYIKMNTPGQENGEIRGWMNGLLGYEKTNMVWRYVGHDNLHVRTVWLNIHVGGEGVGPSQDTAVYLDQMVLATDSQIGGPGVAPPLRPMPPSQLGTD
jgi:hypothetical protein